MNIKIEMEIMLHESQIKYYERQVEDLLNMIEWRKSLIKRLKTRKVEGKENV